MGCMSSNLIKMVLGYKDMSIADLADKLSTSRPNISQKLKRNNFSEKELRDIAEAVGCDLEIAFIDKVTGKRFS